ncbi:KTSC domain-containing protein [Pseudonocardia sp. N23]|uniref:KTSC domain-containing protein n=1 Tax=Pseudonocardia sp. N23 TaxID=1987376 RepID=UPI000BFCCEA6
MLRTPVSSTSLRAIGYDALSSTLEIEFKTGSVYEYAGVSAIEHQNLMSAASHGSYFARNIRDSYSYRRVA